MNYRQLMFGGNSGRPSASTGNTLIGGTMTGTERGQKLNEKRLNQAYQDYAFERAYTAFKAAHDRGDSLYGRMSDAELRRRAQSDAESSARSLDNVFRQMRNTIDKHGGTITVSSSLPDTYRETNANSSIYGTLKYKGIFPVSNESSRKLPEYNPNSRMNKAYVKQHGNQSFGFGLELPKGVIDNYLKKKKK